MIDAYGERRFRELEELGVVVNLAMNDPKEFQKVFGKRREGGAPELPTSGPLVPLRKEED